MRTGVINSPQARYLSWLTQRSESKVALTSCSRRATAFFRVNNTCATVTRKLNPQRSPARLVLQYYVSTVPAYSPRESGPAQLAHRADSLGLLHSRRATMRGRQRRGLETRWLEIREGGVRAGAIGDGTEGGARGVGTREMPGEGASSMEMAFGACGGGREMGTRPAACGR